MTCDFPKEMLALHAEDDLPENDAKVATNHLLACSECRRFLEQLRERQSMLKLLLRQETVSSSAIVGMRRDVMSAIHGSPEVLHWTVRVERLLMLGLRRHRYAFAALALAAVVSVSVLAQMRQASTGVIEPAAVFDGKDTLLRPDGYREWVFVGGSFGPHNAAPDTFHKVYIDRSAYREYSKTGKFPEGTVMVLEMRSSEPNSAIALQASVKDSSRFEGGWGFFDFTDAEGRMKSKAAAQPAVSTCRSCHEERAETDHVFTQFYPALKLARTGPSAESPQLVLMQARRFEATC